MPAVNFSPIFNGWQGFTSTGLPLAGGQIYTYQAGTSTPLPTYTTNVGNIANANPTVLDAGGRPPQELWLDSGYAYKFTLTDSLGSQIITLDNISGIVGPYTAPTLSEWVVTGLAPAYSSATTFTLAGNQVATFEVGRRVRYTLGSGQYTGSVVSSVFGAVTTVVLVTDSIPLDNTLSAVDVGLLDALKPSVPTAFRSPITGPSLAVTGAVAASGAVSAGALSAFAAGVTVGNSAAAGLTTLDWYEETAAFTPVVAFGGASVGVTYVALSRLGNLTRVGDRVHFSFELQLSSKGASAGAVTISGLPFSAGGLNTEYVCNVDAANVVGLFGPISGVVLNGTSRVALVQWTPTGTVSVLDTNFTNSTAVYVTGSYKAA